MLEITAAKQEQEIALLQTRNSDLNEHFQKALSERDRLLVELEKEQNITAQVFVPHVGRSLDRHRLTGGCF